MPLPPKNRFFLTRQSANILEDLLRRLKQSGSISLLYGPRGIGKSCLLNQFVSNRLTPENSVFVQFTASNTFNEGLEGDVEFESDTFFTQQISRLKSGSTLVIDQFDNAPEEIQLNILKYWNQVAFEKSLKLVISVEPKNLHQLTEIANRFQLKIDSVELKPLSRNEQLDFLRSTCCPKLRHIAVVPPELKQSLKLTNGLFSQLEAFQSQFGEQIICQETLLNNHKKFNTLALYTFLVFILLAFFTVTLKNIELTNELSRWHDLTVQNSVKNNTEPKIEADQVVRVQPEQTLKLDQVPPEPADRLEISNKKLISDEVTDELKVVDTRTVQIEPKKVIEEPQKHPVNAPLAQTIFHQRLQATEDWLNSADEKSASIQIMTLSIEKNPQKTLNRYLNKLKSKQVDLNEIKIFSLVKGNRQMYSVLYGEYKDYNIADREIKRLPDVLKANQPIPRTVKGINDERNGR